MVKETYPYKARKTNHIEAEFSGHRLTSYGGLSVFSDFLFDELNFEHLLEKHLHLGMGPNCSYSDGQVFGLVVFGFLCGHRRIAHFETLSEDVVAKQLLGTATAIDEDTIGRRLKRATPKRLNQMNRITASLAECVHAGKSVGEEGRRWVDVDSSVKGTFGNQQGAAKGFNPHKRGQKSYHPLLAFYAGSKEVVHSRWRPGNAHTANGAGSFVAETLARLPKGGQPFVFRADSGFYGDDFLAAVEQADRDHTYLVKVKRKNLNGWMAGKDWQSAPGAADKSYCEFSHQAVGWDRPRRFVGVRILEKVLTDGLFDREVYSYYCYVSNLAEAPLMLHRLYGDRGECENWIQALKGQIGAGTPLANHFWANAMGWQLGVLAYNLMIWLRWLTDTGSWRQEPNTFRWWFIGVAAKLVCHARRVKLKMQSTYLHRSKWERIYRRVGRLNL